LLDLRGGTRSKFNHRDERNKNENRQHDDLRDRERWLSLRRSQPIEMLFVKSEQRDRQDHASQHTDTQSRREAVNGKKKPGHAGQRRGKKKQCVVTGNLCEANIPPTTISPLPIATRVMMT
jgi:hypothetical protein